MRAAYDRLERLAARLSTIPAICRAGVVHPFETLLVPGAEIHHGVPGLTDPFGLAVTPRHNGVYFVDDATNKLRLRH